MKLKQTIALLAALLTTIAASAASTLDIRGEVYNVDTIYHAKVGPGTTHTHLHLTSPTYNYPLHVFYLTVDITTPGVSMRSISATDKVAGSATTSSMATSHSKDGLTYFAGTNGDFYATSGYATNGTSVIGTPTYSNIIDGEIYKSSNSGYQFTVDEKGVPYVSRLNFYKATATIGEKVTLFKGVNVSSPNNGITLYTPRYWGSANQGDYTGSCYQVTAKLVDGDKFRAGHKYRLEITSDPTTNGDTTIPADGFVIHARGNDATGCNTGATDFVSALKVGDIVEFDSKIFTAEGQQIYPLNSISGNPKTVGGGETLDTEGERGDASSRHPRTGIGYSADGTKVIMMVVDGRSQISLGVQTSQLADIMRYAGAAEAMNIDGGGSSTLYIEKLGVQNATSDGHERAVGNCILATLEAPDDNEVAEITFADFRRTIPFMGEYTPTIYAFNKYGRLINTDFKDYTLSCDSELGFISTDGKSLNASGSGLHVLTAKAGEATATILITVAEGTPVSPRYPNVLLDSYRPYEAELISVVDGETFYIDPSILSWSSDNADVATVDENGIIRGVANGTATITGTASFTTAKFNMTIEVPTNTALPAVAPLAENWTVTPTGMNSATVAPLENGVVLDYNIKNTRTAKLTVLAEKPIYSLPEAIRIRINPGESTVKAITVNIRANNAVRAETKEFKSLSLTANAENVLEFNISDLLDTNDIGIYPIEFTSFALQLGGKASTDYKVEIPGVEAVYSPDASGIGDISIDKPSNDGPTTIYNLQGIPVSDPAPGLYIERQGNTATKVIRR